MSRRHWLVAGLVLMLIAFALRAYLLDGQSLWYDEGISAAMAPRALGAITIAAAADIHPPLYYYLLHFWTGIAGDSEYALRFPSLAFGMLTLPLLALIGRRLFNAWVGMLAAWLAATSTLLIYYSQEARMYATLLFLGTLVIYLALRLSSAPHPGPWALALGLATALSLYTHYLAAGPIAAAALFLLISRRGRARWPWWAGALAAALVAWTPWAALSLGQVAGRTGPAMAESVAFVDYLARVTAVFAYGLSFDATMTSRAWLLVLILMVAALLWALPRRISSPSPMGRGGQGVRSPLARTLLWLAVPVVGAYALWLWRPLYNPIVNPRFALPAAPAFYLWLALGLTGLGQAVHYLRIRLLPSRSLTRSVYPIVVGVASLILLFFDSRSLAAYYFEPKYARDDYRALVHDIKTDAEPGDAIVLNAPGQAEVFGYYYRNNPRRADAVYPLPRQRPMNVQQTTAELETIARSHSRIWLVLWADDESDPDGVIESWLQSNGSLAEQREFGAVRLRLYRVAGRG